ncbi:unnamed protein product [Strongylus vulgaris]|uniref:Uncharacterized protein n=1 Tax=Strongylus vulgaris TaxID=40348 RepID=A0A3P7IMP6_STRVU|nr:unnamed protein product [Strongylus vulgaris]
MQYRILFRAWKDFRPLTEWKRDVDTIVDLFTRTKEPVNFVAWYIAEPDHALHVNGYYNFEFEKMLSQLDNLFGYFLEKMDRAGLTNEVNIIFTADHGHTQV